MHNQHGNSIPLGALSRTFPKYTNSKLAPAECECAVDWSRPLADADEMRNWQKTGSDLLRKMELEDAAYSVKEGNLEVPEDQKYQ